MPVKPLALLFPDELFVGVPLACLLGLASLARLASFPRRHLVAAVRAGGQTARALVEHFEPVPGVGRR
eukprot:7662835-Pyramimonas_sp.AAC.1